MGLSWEFRSVFFLKNDVNIIEEDKILVQSENVLIISAEPGMGKSLMLDKLVFDSKSEMFCFKIMLSLRRTGSLKTFPEILSKLEQYSLTEPWAIATIV